MRLSRCCVTQFCFRLKDLESKERLIDCELPSDVVSDALGDMDVDVAHSSIRFSAVVSKQNAMALCVGKIQGAVRLPCQRCLGPADVSVDQPLHTVFVPPTTKTESTEQTASDEDDEDDLDYAHHDGETVDLAPILREHLILTIPITVYCKESCRGLCAGCGADRNEGDCSCPPAEKLSPFSALRELKL